MEKYEAGSIEADAAADQIFAMIWECDLVPPAFGWKKDETMRFPLPTPAQTAKFMYWATRQVPPGEMRDLGRSLVGGVARAAVKGEKLH